MAKRKTKANATPLVVVEPEPFDAVPLAPEDANGNQPSALTSLADLRPDRKNANLGTDRGRAALAESVEACGLGRSIVVDKHGVVISGNKTLDAAKAQHADMELVPTTGTELVVVQRTDLDLIEDTRARRLAYYDNRVQELDINWSGAQLEADLLAGVEVGEAFFPEEFDRLVKTAPAPLPAPPEALDPGVDPLAPVAPAEPAAPAEPVEDPAVAAAQKAAEAGTEKPGTFLLTFNTLEQQLKWNAFMRRLREVYPGLPSSGARLAAHTAAHEVRQ